MQEDIIVNGFADEHSLRKSFPASDLEKQNSTQRKLEHTLTVIKSWMDTMRPRLETVQNICAKLVLQCSKYLSATQALMDLHWLPI